MPPSQMCSSVSSTREKNAGAAVRVGFSSRGARSPARQSSSKIAHCGNFGAPRRPPCCRSIARAMPFAARSSSASADHDLAGGPRLLGEPLHQGVAVLADALGLLAEQPRDLAQHIDEGGAAVARVLRKIRAAPHRLARGREEHRERPAALLAEQMQRVHVDLVDVGPLLAVDLDVDEQLVHHARGRLVLEALVRHHVAPVAGRVADREQDRLVGRAAPRASASGPHAHQSTGLCWCCSR